MQPAEVYERLDHIEKEFGGVLGVSAQGIGKQSDLPRINRQADETFPAASTIKVPILYTALRLADLGRVSLSERIPLTAEDQVAGSGVLRDLEPGLEPTFYDLLMLMTIVSDNTATNMVIDRIGTAAVNDDAKDLGCLGTVLAGKLMLPKERQNAAQRAGHFNRTTPADMLRYVLALHAGEGLSVESRTVAHRILYRQQVTDSLVRLLPWPRTEPNMPWRIASKSGSIRGVRHQVGWLDGPGGAYAFAIMTKDCPDVRFSPENLGNLAVAKAMRTLYDYFIGHQ
ncbi:MAG: serine hydrolase [Firmicutes bacterium]|nr:serine hydrolase [Bacillota bacterium]